MTDVTVFCSDTILFVLSDLLSDTCIFVSDTIDRINLPESFRTWVLLYVGPFVRGSFCTWVLLYDGSFCSVGPFVWYMMYSYHDP